MEPQIHEVISYQDDFLKKEEANSLFKHLIKYDDLTEMMVMQAATGDTFKCNFGKMMFIDNDLIATNKFPAIIWGTSTSWSEEMLTIKQRVEQLTQTEFKTCVCIYYPDGNSGVDFHSDRSAFGDTSILPSLSLGEERKFCLRNIKSKEETCMVLKHGSLVVMQNGCQEHYEHSLPINPAYKNPRINITFRKYGYETK
ncbi:MAG: DNA repair protein [Croceitalea sp.]|nr:DNA repair protein [Croceitalea sp.]